MKIHLSRIMPAPNDASELANAIRMLAKHSTAVFENVQYPNRYNIVWFGGRRDGLTSIEVIRWAQTKKAS